MSLRLQPVRVHTNSRDADGLLVFRADLLVAVLVRLSDDYGDKAGMWFLKAGFGSIDHPYPPTFPNLEEAQGWIAQRLAGRRQSSQL